VSNVELFIHDKHSIILKGGLLILILPTPWCILRFWCFVEYISLSVKPIRAQSYELVAVTGNIIITWEAAFSLDLHLIDLLWSNRAWLSKFIFFRLFAEELHFLENIDLVLDIKSAPASKSWGQARIKALRKRSSTKFYFCSAVSTSSVFFIRLWFNLLCCKSEKKLSNDVENICLASHISLVTSIWLIEFSSMLSKELSPSMIPLYIA